MARSPASQWAGCGSDATNAFGRILFTLACLLPALCAPAWGEPSRVPAGALEAAPADAVATTSAKTAPAPGAQGESVEQALCRIIEGAAGRHALPVEFFTRLIWRESAFRAGAVSPKGAQGIAQFMPGTAAERGLANPFDPEAALPASAALLAELRERFGNLGLAAAAYNAGPARIERWLSGQGGLPLETQDYLIFITGRAAEEWATERTGPATANEAAAGRVAAGERTPGAAVLSSATPASAAALAIASMPETKSALAPASTPGRAAPMAAALPLGPTGCLGVTAALRRGGGEVAQEIATITAPWGVQLSGNFSKARALASYQRTQKRFAALLEGTQPMIIGARLRSRGSRAFYRVRVAQPSRQAAQALCSRLRALGGACIVLPS